MEDIKDPIVDQILVNFLEDMHKYVDKFYENKKDDIDAAFLYDGWKLILGSLDYLMSHASNKVMRYIVREMFQQMASRVAHEVRRESHVDARYLMEKFVVVVEKLLEDVEDNRRWGNEQPVRLEVIPTAPVFVCGKCELDKERDYRQWPLAN